MCVCVCLSVGLCVTKAMSNDNCCKYQPIFVKFSGNVDSYKDTNPTVFGSDRPPCPHRGLLVKCPGSHVTCCGSGPKQIPTPPHRCSLSSADVDSINFTVIQTWKQCYTTWLLWQNIFFTRRSVLSVKQLHELLVKRGSGFTDHFQTGKYILTH